MYIVKLDGSGNLLWSKTAGGTGYEDAYSIIQTTDGGYTVTGFTASFGAGLEDMYTVKLDGSGTLQWSRTSGGNDYDEAYSIKQTTDGGYAVAGFTQSFGAGEKDMYIVKLDASGNTCSNSTSPTSSSGTGGTLNSPTSTVTSPAPTITSPSLSFSNGGTVTTLCVIGIRPISTETPNQFSLSQNYPNPFNPRTVIRYSLIVTGEVGLRIFDVLGNEASVLVNERQLPGTYEESWDASNYPSGVYYYKLTAGDYTETKKMVLIK
jgi:hypothetical protein